MKLKDQINNIINLKIFLVVFIFLVSNKSLTSERNFVVATVDRSPITYYDLKQRAKLIHFLKTKNNDYKNSNKYFELSLESLISQKLLVKKATEFNKNIIKLTEKDAYEYILERNKNSNEVFDKFLKKNKLSKSVVVSKNIKDVIARNQEIRTCFKGK